STLRVEAAVFGSDVSLRCPTEGDRIEFERGSKAVRTVLSERGVPKRRRSTWPLLVSGGRIAAIVGIRVAPWARGTTNRFVAIVYERGRL
ncbi:MAG TPA: tRNA lysidine(34) synthetase TilS, partial [Acidimicrobiia bacterium]|nr:tRNA lysidine(34) synthetase TilS [Acidimicrobiia bacterium]